VVGDDGRVERIPYELCVLIALRDALRRREVYVQGAGRWQDPDEDLPGDFEDNRDVHYAELGKPLDAAEFIGGLRRRLDEALTRLDTALARNTSGRVRGQRVAGVGARVVADGGGCRWPGIDIRAAVDRRRVERCGRRHRPRRPRRSLPLLPGQPAHLPQRRFRDTRYRPRGLRRGGHGTPARNELPAGTACGAW